ncbi:MAG TPA: hypothetical protein VNH18_10950 [Bryobacteraceae bacterium]|nr:hypothetical protein [Bryobacteraceae bacterium]
MRRLFSTFAQGWPGAGLLILRLVACSAIFAFRLRGLEAAQPMSVPPMIAGALLSVGLWTPVSGCVVAAFALYAAITKSSDPWNNILLAAMCIALAMIGPGVWSLDARLFGWRRTVIRDR